jgi:hypothetical protein
MLPRVVFLLLVFCGGAIAQSVQKRTADDTKKLLSGKRPVLITARDLQQKCLVAQKVIEGFSSEETVKASPNEIITMAQCYFYVHGVLDGQFDAHSSQRRPNLDYEAINLGISDEGTLVRMFIKYVNDHPEKENVAASSVLLYVSYDLH